MTRAVHGYPPVLSGPGLSGRNGVGMGPLLDPHQPSAAATLAQSSVVEPRGVEEPDGERRTEAPEVPSTDTWQILCPSTAY